MTKSIRKQAKRLRRKAKPHDPHAQSPGYWKKETQRREQSAAACADPNLMRLRAITGQ